MPSQAGEAQNQIYIKAEKLAARLARAFNMMEASPPFRHKGRVILCMSILYHACLSYLIDLDRWWSFHGGPGPDRHKRAAFLFKWLARMRPVQLLSVENLDATLWELSANGYFALLGALGELRIDMAAFAKSPEARPILYTALYRDILPASWAITFCLLEKVYPGGPAEEAEKK